MKFVALALFLFVGSFALFFWIAGGTSAHAPKRTTGTTDTASPTTKDAAARQREEDRRFAEAAASGYQGDTNPTRTALRLALVGTTKSLAADMCDTTARRAYASAYSAYFNAKSRAFTSCTIICQSNSGMDRLMTEWETPLDDFAALGARKIMAGGTFKMNVMRDGNNQTFTLTDNPEIPCR